MVALLRVELDHQRVRGARYAAGEAGTEVRVQVFRALVLAAAPHQANALRLRAMHDRGDAWEFLNSLLGRVRERHDAFLVL
jgi:hypothetical protein